MKKLIYILPLICLMSCQRSCSSLSRSIESSERHYTVKMYSGGKCVFTDKVYTMINNSESSDGIYYYNSKDELIEIGGDYILTSK